MDVFTKTFMAVDEITRTEADWRSFTNQAPCYEYRSCIRPAGPRRRAQD